ncbi:MAG: PAS domain S-box protein [Gammaproteobacteria bacterium]|nr:PAS domain S-box protein [Gammaproteobacteria bacterium]
MISFLKRLCCHSLARQLMLGIALVHAVLMTVFVFDFISRQKDFMFQQQNVQAISLAETLAANGAAWMNAGDAVVLSDIIAAQSKVSGLRRIIFLDMNGKALADAGFVDQEFIINSDSSMNLLDKPVDKPAHSKILVATESAIDVLAPAWIKNKHIGWVRVVLSRDKLITSFDEITQKGLIYIAVAILAGTVFAWFMANGLTRGIRQLTMALQKIIDGERDVKVSLNRHDELQELSHDFNEMLHTMNEREQKLHISHDALKNSESRYRRLVENVTPDYFFYLYDTSGVFTFLSPAIENVLGYSPEEFIGFNNKYLTDNPVNEKAKEYSQRSMRGEKQPVYEVEIYHKDGNVHLLEVTEVPVFDNQNNVIAVEGFAHDITQRKLSQQALLEEKEKLLREQSLLRSLIDSVPDFIFYKDTDSVYIGCNKAFETFAGLSEEDIIGKTDLDLFPAEVGEFFREMDKKMLHSKQSRENEEWVTYPDGRRVLLTTLKTPFYTVDGKVLGLIGISRDITEQRLNEENMYRSQKMEALGKLTGGIAHDYNNMLGVIMGYAEILAMALQKEEKLSRYVAEIRKAGERGATLTRKLLAFTKRRASQSDVVNVNDLLNADRQILQRTLTARIQISMDLYENIWLVWMDRAGFQDAILNICINAMHAMPDGGVLSITTHNIHLQKPEAQNLHLREGDYVQIGITDNGIGMDKETRSRIFDPFFTTKGEKGTGLGLSQVYGFVEGLGGTIHVYSELNQGTSFIIYLPGFQGDIEETINREETGSQTTAGNETILIVDDEPSLRDLAEEILINHGYTVYKAEDAMAALEILANSGLNIDLIISDVIMPGVNGYQLAQKVADIYPHLKIIMASGFTDMQHLNTEGINQEYTLLHKPYSSNDILKAIRNSLDEPKI